MAPKNKKKKLGFLFDELFNFDFDVEIEDMQKEMQELFLRMHKDLKEENFEKFIKPGKPKVYGFSFTINPKGKTEFHEFGNLKPLIKKKKTDQPSLLSDERKPIIDILKGKTEVVVIAEVPGACKEDVKLSGDKNTLIIDVKSKRRYYHKIDLPAPVSPASRKFTCKNGILEVKLKRRKN